MLSFYAFALWIGIGVDELPRRQWRWLALLAPLTLAAGNWSDHDRSRCHSVHDIAVNHLESCASDAILITLGDNDTFPLWYLQQVERRRTDISIYNLGLTGWGNIQRVLQDNDFRRPVYVSHYFYQRFGALFADRLHCSGFCWQLLPDGDHPPATGQWLPAFEWHITKGEYIDPIATNFLTIWQQNTGMTPK